MKTGRMHRLSGTFFAAALAVFMMSSNAFAEEVLNVREISLSMAREAADAAIERARKDGYRVSVTVVNRAGQIVVQLRDDGAAPHTTDTSWRNAYTALTLRASTSELMQRAASNPSAAGLADITGVIMLAGGLPIRAGGETIGAIGVGGAPGGDKDEICGQAGIERISARLK